MTAFFLAASISFLFYQVLAHSHIPSTNREITVGSVHISFGSGSAPWVRRILRFLIVALVLICTLFLHAWIRPWDWFSENRAGIIFGILFGPLFGIWFNAVIAHPAGEGLTWGLIIGGIGLILLFIMGSLGNEFGTVIRGYARNITTVKGAGFELAFEKGRKEAPGLGALPPPGKTFGAITGSSGLQYLILLDELIERDEKYLQLFEAVESQQLKRQPPGDRQKQAIATLTQHRGAFSTHLTEAVKFTRLTITPPLTCLAWWHGRTRDSSVTDRHVQVLGDVLRTLQLSDIRNALGVEGLAAADRFVELSLRIASDVVLSSRELDESDEDCDPLIMLLCPDAVASVKPEEKKRARKNKKAALLVKELAEAFGRAPDNFVFDRARITECLNVALSSINRSLPKATEKSPEPIKNYQEKVNSGLSLFLGGHGVSNRPYFAITQASIMAHLGQYEAMAETLDGWIQRRAKADWESAGAWLDVRARSILAAYGEEWLRREGSREGGAATALINEHTENLKLLRTVLFGWAAQAPFLKETMQNFQKAREPEFRRQGTCTTEGPAATVDLWRSLFDSYVSIELTYAQNVLRHPEYEGKFAETITSELDRLINLDLSCIPGASSEADLYRARFSEVYARNAVKYSQVRAKSEGETARKKRLDLAERATQFGIERVRDAADTAQRNRSGLPILRRIEPSLPVETRESLGVTLSDIRKTRQEFDK
jgi:hypothetical protein